MTCNFFEEITLKTALWNKIAQWRNHQSRQQSAIQGSRTVWRWSRSVRKKSRNYLDLQSYLSWHIARTLIPQVYLEETTSLYPSHWSLRITSPVATAAEFLFKELTAGRSFPSLFEHWLNSHLLGAVSRGIYFEEREQKIVLISTDSPFNLDSGIRSQVLETYCMFL